MYKTDIFRGNVYARKKQYKLDKIASHLCVYGTID